LQLLQPTLPLQLQILPFPSPLPSALKQDYYRLPLPQQSLPQQSLPLPLQLPQSLPLHLQIQQQLHLQIQLLPRLRTVLAQLLRHPQHEQRMILAILVLVLVLSLSWTQEASPFPQTTTTTALKHSKEQRVDFQHMLSPALG
jgi:hypothetical protein